MKSHKHLKKKIIADQAIADKKFFKRLVMIIGLATITILAVNFVILSWCEIKFNYRVKYLFGKEVPRNFICMAGNVLRIHEATQVMIDGELFFACSSQCVNKLRRSSREYCLARDTITGNSVCKADAIIGFKTKKHREVLYFENQESFNKYYQKLKENN